MRNGNSGWSSQWATIWGLVLLVTFGAGCIDASGNDESPGSPPTQEAESADVFTETFPLHIRPDLELIAYGGYNTNCVFFWDTDGANYTIQGGTATLEWDASQLTETMRLRTTGAETDIAGGPAGSPLVLDLGTLSIPEGRWGIGFWADYSIEDFTVPIEQTADLTLEFFYNGELPDASTGTCSGGGL